jgi:hypothetical protein
LKARDLDPFVPELIVMDGYADLGFYVSRIAQFQIADLDDCRSANEAPFASDAPAGKS